MLNIYVTAIYRAIKQRDKFENEVGMLTKGTHKIYYFYDFKVKIIYRFCK